MAKIESRSPGFDYGRILHHDRKGLFLVWLTHSDLRFIMFQAIVAWFYTGQPEQEIMLACGESVAQFIASGGEEAAGEAAAEGSHAALRTFAKILDIY